MTHDPSKILISHSIINIHKKYSLQNTIYPNINTKNTQTSNLKIKLDYGMEPWALPPWALSPHSPKMPTLPTMASPCSATSPNPLLMRPTKLSHQDRITKPPRPTKSDPHHHRALWPHPPNQTHESLKHNHETTKNNHKAWERKREQRTENREVIEEREDRRELRLR